MIMTVGDICCDWGNQSRHSIVLLHSYLLKWYCARAKTFIRSKIYRSAMAAFFFVSGDLLEPLLKFSVESDRGEWARDPEESV